MVQSRLPAVAIAFVLVISSLAFVPAPADAGPPPFGIGDWTVTGQETLADASLVLDGNLVVQNGGSLTLSNTTLLVFCAYDGEHQITVMPGGTLNVLDRSVVGSMDPMMRHGFNINSGATVRFENSEFDAAGSLGQYFWQNGGIMLGTSSATISNCTFRGNTHGDTPHWGCAMTVTGTGVTLRDCKFYINDWGIVSMGSTVKLFNCSFSYNFDAAINFHGTMEADNCTFNHNGNGLIVDHGNLDALHCNFLNNSRTGIRCMPEGGIGLAGGTSYLDVVDCVFERNRVGMDAQWVCYDDIQGTQYMYHELRLQNSVFRDNQVAALDWPNRERADPEFPNQTSNSVWTVTRDCGAYNNTIYFNGRVSVESGGVLTLDHTDFGFDGSQDGDSSTEVKSGGALRLVSNSSLSSRKHLFMYKLAARAGSSFELLDSSLRDCGWNESTLEYAGPYMETGKVRILNSSLDYCPYGMVFVNEKGALMDGTTVRGLTTGLCMVASDVMLRNSTLSGVAGFTALLSGASLLDSLNSTFDRVPLQFTDSLGMVNISWYLDTRTMWTNGSLAAGANITIVDSDGNLTGNSRTGQDGWSRDAVLKEVSITKTSSRRFTPHKVTGSLMNITNTTSVEMDASKGITVKLNDGEDPRIDIGSPADNGWMRTSSALIEGTATDNICVSDIELTVDGFRRFTVYSDPEGGRNNVSWNLSVDLSEGPHSIEARVLDSSGNAGSAMVTFTIDSLAPRIYIRSPPDGHLTNLSLTTVTGSVEIGARVLLQGSEVATIGDSFSGSVVLNEGENLITAQAIDQAGNVNVSSVHVTLDTRPPALDVVSPVDRLALRVDLVEVNGTMEEGAMVFVNSRWAAPIEGPGRFRTAISLSQGWNAITVTATDAAGNTNITVRNVLLDIIPPFLELRTPPEGLLVNHSALFVAGSSEGGANVSIDGAWTLMAGEPGTRSNFSQTLTLKEGDNLLIVRARDAAGNENRIARHVRLDSTPPELVISHPPNNYRTTNASVYLTGHTEPGARATLNGDDIIVGHEGLFTVEVKLVTGRNLVTVRAVDEAGNSRELTLTVMRDQQGGTGVSGTLNPGPDWAFIAFLCCAVTFMMSDAYILNRHFKRLPDRRLSRGRER